MTETILKYISEQLLNNELEDELEVTDDLLGDGILDSLGMMKLILFIEQNILSKYHLKIWLSKTLCQ